MKIVFCSSEVFPFAKTGGLADVCGALPIALEKMGEEITIILPRYGSINTEDGRLKHVNKEIWTTTIGKNIQVYFIEKERYFDCSGLYGDESGDYHDNLDRFQFFSKKALELLKQLNIKANIIHCHDWQSSLIPVYLKTLFAEDDFYFGIRTILTIHNLAYQGIFPKDEYGKLGLDKKFFSKNGFEFFDKISLLKAGILFSDMVTTVSPGYAKEIMTEKLGCGLDDVLQSREDRFVGILNGIDTDIWDPQKDPLIDKTYSLPDIRRKCENKKILQEMSGLSVREDVPLFGFVGRLDYQKGVDIIAEALGRVADLDLQVVLLGLGEEKYQHILRDLAERYPHNIACHLMFDEKMAHQIYAGSDVFLMPSRYEPCGLSQMISLRYGTIPLVFKTGGLSDTIFHYDCDHGNGFVFSEYNANALAQAMNEVLDVYKNKDVFGKLVERSFDHDFSWEKSAEKYAEVYKQCLALD